MPKISIIITTYNRANFLPRAINSVLNQTYQNFEEVIIVDDGSTDNTKDVVHSFQKKDSRIKYIRTEHSGGYPSKVMNVGIKESKGDIITSCASDDEWDPRYLEKFISVFRENNDTDVVGCNMAIYAKNNSLIKEIPKPKNNDNEFIIKMSLTKNHILGGNLMIPKDILVKTGLFDENIKLAEDIDMWIRLAKYGCKFKFIYEPLYRIYSHNDHISSNASYIERAETWEYLIEKHRDTFQKYPSEFSVFIRTTGILYIRGGEINKGRKFILDSIKLKKTNLRHYAALFLSIGGKYPFLMISKIRKLFFS